MSYISYAYNKRKLSAESEKKEDKKKLKENDDVVKKDDSTNIINEANRIYFKGLITDDKIENLIEIINKKNKIISDFRNNTMISDIVPKPLYLHITSYGGNLLATFRAIDAIKRSKIPIYTIVDGYAASGATLMSIVGKKRFMTPNSYMLIHQLSSGSVGKFWEIKDDFENCESWMNDIYDLYIKHTKMNLDDLKKYLAHDKWWKADQCVECGLVDEIYDDDDLLEGVLSAL
jgi:ATP-dependent protease ClpP protease subunit